MNDRMFTNKDLRAMIIPLFIEQFLLLLVGMADTFVVSFVGDAAVSGVSLVNSFNTVAIFLFSALASGGAEADQIQRGIYCGAQCQYFRQAQSHSGKICRRRYDGADRCHH